MRFLLGVLLAVQSPAPPSLIQRPGWKTRLVRVMSCIGFLWAMVARNAQFLKTWPMASLPMVVTSSSLLEAFSLLPRSQLDATVGLWEAWILTGSVKIPHTNSLRWSSLIHSRKLPDGILTPSGSPDQSTCTGRCKGWHLQAARAMALGGATSSPYYWWFSPFSLEKAQNTPAPLLLLI